MAFSLLNGLSSAGAGLADYSARAGQEAQRAESAAALQRSGADIATTAASTLAGTQTELTSHRARLEAESAKLAASVAQAAQARGFANNSSERALDRGASVEAATVADQRIVLRETQQQAATAWEGALTRAGKAAERAAADLPFAGPGDWQAANRIILSLMPSLQDGTISETNRRIYGAAYAKLTEPGAPQFITDPNDPTRERLQSVPKPAAQGILSPDFTRSSAPATETPSSSVAPLPAPNAAASSAALAGAPINIPGASRQKAMNETEGKAGSFADRMIFADETLRATPAASWMDNRLGDIGDKIGTTFLSSDDYEVIDQARRTFINAILRRESGAVITPDEFSNARKQYFPVPGNGPKVIAQKARTREIAILGMIREGGSAYIPLRSSDAAATPRPDAKAAATPKPQTILPLDPAKRLVGRTYLMPNGKMGIWRGSATGWEIAP